MVKDQLPYHDRYEAGEVLASHLSRYAGQPEVVILGLPRGGIPVAYQISRILDVPLDVFVVRKLGVPGHEELAMGAIASGDVQVINPQVTAFLKNSEMVLQEVSEREKCELNRREKLYRGNLPPVDVKGKTVILVDDGVATGASMRAAIKALKLSQVNKLVVAVPVGAAETCSELEQEVDEVVCAATPIIFYGVGQFYEDFSQTTDEEVRDLLNRAAYRKLPVTRVQATNERNTTTK